MKFKYSENGNVLAILSEREKEKFPTSTPEIEIKENMKRTVQGGKYKASLLGKEVEIEVTLTEDGINRVANCKINGEDIYFRKPRPIRKYDILRHVVVTALTAD